MEALSYLDAVHRPAKRLHLKIELAEISLNLRFNNGCILVEFTLEVMRSNRHGSISVRASPIGLCKQIIYIVP